jgi:hypothetical protein
MNWFQDILVSRNLMAILKIVSLAALRSLRADLLVTKGHGQKVVTGGDRL